MIDFYSSQPQVNSVVQQLNQRKTGINGKNIIVSAELVPPSPSKEEWEAVFNCNFDEAPIGYRPDTVILSNLPVNWFQLENTSHIHSSSELFIYMSQFGEIQYEFGSVSIIVK